jgi:hypothetical protein
MGPGRQIRPGHRPAVLVSVLYAWCSPRLHHRDASKNRIIRSGRLFALNHCQAEHCFFPAAPYPLAIAAGIPDIRVVYSQ